MKSKQFSKADLLKILPKPPRSLKVFSRKQTLNLDTDSINDSKDKSINIPIPPSHRHTRSYGRIPPIPYSFDSHQSFGSYSPALTPSNALLQNHQQLSQFEIKEISHFKELFYIGCGRKANENALVDREGYYVVVLGDHLIYRYEIIEQLGKGSFGTVVKCKDHKTGETVAIKIIRKNTRILRYGKREVEVLDLLSKSSEEASSCIVEKIEEFYFREQLCIVFELLAISLYDFLKNNNFTGILPNLARRIATQALIALKHSHSMGIIHCDVKPENIVFKQLNKSGIKVVDFGSTCTTKDKCYGYIQSRFYRAPEVLLEAEYNETIDIWSLGCVIVEMITGWPLFPGVDEAEVLHQIINTIGKPPRHLLLRSKGRDKIRMQDLLNSNENSENEKLFNDIGSLLEGHDAKLIDFVKKCLVWDKDTRITAEAALLHPWIKGTHINSSR